MRLVLLAVLLSGSIASAGIFDDQNPVQNPPASVPGQTAPRGAQPVSVSPAPPGSPDLAAQQAHEAAIKKARLDYGAAIAAADRKLLADLDAAMDQAMAKKNVEDVKRIDAEKTVAMQEISLLEVAPPEAAPAAPVAPPRAAGPKSVVFAFRCSGAMINKIAAVKDRLKKEIHALDPSQQFNVVMFQDRTVTSAFTAMRLATAQSQDNASQFVDTAITRGVSNIAQATPYALQFKPEVLYLLTGSDMSEPGGPILAAFKSADPNHATKVCPMVFAESAADEKAGGDELELMRQIAVDSGGEVEVVRMNGSLVASSATSADASTADRKNIIDAIKRGDLCEGMTLDEANRASRSHGVLFSTANGQQVFHWDIKAQVGTHQVITESHPDVGGGPPRNEYATVADVRVVGYVEATFTDGKLTNFQRVNLGYRRLAGQ